LLRPAFIAACDDAVKTVARELAGLKGLHVVVGHPRGGDVRSKSVQVQMRYNAASVLSEGRVLETYAKRELPNYQVFDEHRYFTRGQGTCVFQVEGINVGLLICEDAWFEEPAQLARVSGAQLLVVINASPFHVGKETASASPAWPTAPGRRTCRWSTRTRGRAGRGGVRRRLLRRERRRLAGRARLALPRGPVLRAGERRATPFQLSTGPMAPRARRPRRSCGTRW
jgi:predicted amidohydrolase